MIPFPNFDQMKALTASIKAALAKKQNKLTGTAGQVVGFAEDGSAQAQEDMNLPRAGGTMDGEINFNAPGYSKHMLTVTTDMSHKLCLTKIDTGYALMSVERGYKGPDHLNIGIGGVADPAVDNDAVNKSYVDTGLSKKAGFAVTGSTEASRNVIYALSGGILAVDRNGIGTGIDMIVYANTDCENRCFQNMRIHVLEDVTFTGCNFFGVIIDSIAPGKTLTFINCQLRTVTMGVDAVFTSCGFYGCQMHQYSTLHGTIESQNTIWAGINPASDNTWTVLCYGNYPDSTNSLREYPCSNRNLLDNWYFAKPINQRGKTEYTGAGYTIDRWVSLSSSLSVQLMDGFLRLVGSADYQEFSQKIEEGRDLRGRTATLSILYRADKSVRVYMYSDAPAGQMLDSEAPAAADWAIHSVTGEIADLVYGTGKLRVNICPRNSGQVDIKAVKLELGDHQTIAHKEGDNWVLNDPPPDPALELAKCQRYYIQGHLRAVPYLFTGNTCYCIMYLPVSMRSVPSIVGSYSAWNVADNSHVENVVVSVGEIADNHIVFNVNGANGMCYIDFGGAGLSCDL